MFIWLVKPQIPQDVPVWGSLCQHRAAQEVSPVPSLLAGWGGCWDLPGCFLLGGAGIFPFRGLQSGIFHFSPLGDEAETFPLMSCWSRGLSVSFSVPGAVFCSGMELMANVRPRHFGFVFFPSSSLWLVASSWFNLSSQPLSTSFSASTELFLCRSVKPFKCLPLPRASASLCCS